MDPNKTRKIHLEDWLLNLFQISIKICLVLLFDLVPHENSFIILNILSLPL